MFEPPEDFSQTSIDFLSHLRSGDQSAWAEFHRLYASTMLARSLRVGFQYADAEEVVSDFFFRVYNALVRRQPGEEGGFDRTAPGQRFRYWLRIVFLHTYQDLQRELAKLNAKIHDENLIARLATAATNENALSVDDADVQQALEPFITMLEEEFGRNGKLDEWRMFLLIEGLEWNSTEVGTEMQLKPNTVRVKVKRLLEAFRKRYGIPRIPPGT